MKSNNLSICLVSYCSEPFLLSATLNSLQKAVNASMANAYLFFVDHSPSSNENLVENNISLYWSSSYELIQDATNPGFSFGHNRALKLSSIYHLILNPDLEIAPDTLQNALEFMEQHPECGLLTPYATWGDGQVQRLCKRYPTVFDLLLRGFSPTAIKKYFKTRLDHYDMADKLNEQDVLWDPPIVSGCFMLFRTDVFKKLGGFDPRFFLYFEDFDISLRASMISRIAYVPQVRVVHHGGHASRKGWRHIWMFGRSMITFFNIHGWRWW